jgi:plasmid stabilization system protein ParE
MTYRLRITRRAQNDRDACFDYIFARSPQGAVRWLDALEEAAAAVLIDPHHGVAPESEGQKEPIRQKLFRTPQGRTYRLLYIVRDDVIYIIHVRGAGQDVMTAAELELPDPQQ